MSQPKQNNKNDLGRSYEVLADSYKATPQKKRLFWSNPYKIEIMITSLIDMLELPNFDHMRTSTI